MIKEKTKATSYNLDVTMGYIMMNGSVFDQDLARFDDELNKEIPLEVQMFLYINQDFVRAFCESGRIQIYPNFIDIGRGEYKISLYNNQLLLMKKVGYVDLAKKHYMINKNHFRRYPLKHQSIVPLLGWTTVGSDLYYAYMYFKTPVEDYISISDISHHTFKKIARKIFEGVLYLNRRKFFLATDQLYIDEVDDVPVFSEDIIDVIVIIKEMIKNKETYNQCIRKFVNYYINQTIYLENIFSKFLVLKRFQTDKLHNFIQSIHKMNDILLKFIREVEEKQLSEPANDEDDKIRNFYCDSETIFIEVENHLYKAANHLNYPN